MEIILLFDVCIERVLCVTLNLFQLNITGKCGTSTCIDVCPFGQSFFWVRLLSLFILKALFLSQFDFHQVGCNDGTIRLHYLNIERPIVQLKNGQHSDEIKALQWSKTKPLTVYTLDNNSR